MILAATRCLSRAAQFATCRGQRKMASSSSVFIKLLDLPEEVIDRIVRYIGATAVPNVLNLQSSPDSFHDALEFCSLHPRLLKHLRTLFCSVHLDGYEFTSAPLAPILSKSIRNVSVDGFGSRGEISFLRSLAATGTALEAFSCSYLNSRIFEESVGTIMKNSAASLRALQIHATVTRWPQNIAPYHPKKAIDYLLPAMRNVDTLHVGWSDFWHEDLVDLISATDGNLRHLCLHNSRFFVNVADFTLFCIAQLCPALQSLKISGSLQFTPHGFCTFLQLTGDSLRSISFPGNFTRCAISRNDMHIIAASCPQLNHFDIHCRDEYQSVEDISTISVLRSSLISLRVYADDSLTSIDAGFLVNTLVHLRELRLVSKVTNDVIVEACKAIGSRLHLLELECHEDVSLEHVFMAVASCTSLRMLCIAGDVEGTEDCGGPSCALFEILLRGIGANLRRLALFFSFGGMEKDSFEPVDFYKLYGEIHLTAAAVVSTIWRHCKQLAFLQLHGVEPALGGARERYISLFKMLQSRMPKLVMYVEDGHYPLWFQEQWDSGSSELGKAAF